MAMKRVKFTALPDESGPVSPDRLDELQDNVEEYIDDSLKLTGLNEGRTTVISGAELNELGMLNGFAYVTTPKVNGVPVLGNGYLFQLCYAATYKIQILARATTDDSCLYVRRMINNSWEDFAPICERITEGEEEPTNKFIDNKRVYVKRLDIGNLPNATTKNVNHGLSNVKIERLEGVATNNGLQALPLPFASEQGASSSIRLQSWGSYVSVYTGTDRSAFTGVVDIYYTKN